MAKIAIFDDFKALGNLAAGPLIAAGYDVKVWCTPINFEEVLDFGPNLIKLELYRNKDARNRPIRNAEQDVLGYKPLVDLERYPAAQVIPVMLVGIDLQEEDIPTSVNYDLFLTFPEDADIMLPKVAELVEKVKTRRKISGYLCPVCRSRLTFIKQPATDLFCPRCHSAVVIIDERDCLYMKPGESKSTPCTLAELAPPSSSGG